MSGRNETRKFVGECIYCGSREGLSDEHCIPYGLKGNRVLEKASCPDCAEVTTLFEQKYLRDSMGPARAVLGIRTRHKKTRPSHFPMRFKREGRFVEKMVPLDEFVPIIPFIEIGPPGHLASETTHVFGLKHREFRIESYTVEDFRGEGRESKVLRKYNAEAAQVRAELSISDFIRMIAKIAYCEAVHRYGINAFEEVFVRKGILTDTDELLEWVGSDGERIIFESYEDMNATHVVAVGRFNSREIRARVKLFSGSSTPEYTVVVGKLREKHAALFDALAFK